MICYRPQAVVLEVGSLKAYIHQYKGGLRDETGAIIVRDMEGMISQIAQHCANAARVPVGVCANLVIMPKQQMYLLVRKKPEGEQRMSRQQLSWRRMWTTYVTGALAMIASSAVTSISISMHLAFLASVMLLALALLPVMAISLGMIWVKDRAEQRKERQS